MFTLTLYTLSCCVLVGQTAPFHDKLVSAIMAISSIEHFCRQKPHFSFMTRHTHACPCVLWSNTLLVKPYRYLTSYITVQCCGALLAPWNQCSDIPLVTCMCPFEGGGFCVSVKYAHYVGHFLEVCPPPAGSIHSNSKLVVASVVYVDMWGQCVRSVGIMLCSHPLCAGDQCSLCGTFEGHGFCWCVCWVSVSMWDQWEWLLQLLGPTLKL